MKYLFVLLFLAIGGCATAQNAPPIEEATGPMKFVVSSDSRGECRWNLVSSNGRVIAKSSEGYSSKRSCDRSIELTKSAGNAEVVDSR